MGNKHKRSIRRDADALSLIMPYIGDLPLSKVHLGTIQPFINDRLASGVSGGTVKGACGKSPCSEQVMVTLVLLFTYSTLP